MPAAKEGWSFACPDWVQRLATGQSLVPDLPLDEEAVKRAIAVFNLLRIPDATGQPKMEDAAGDWQRDILAAVAGSVDEDGIRHVRQPFVLVPKKNSKTTGGGAILLTMLILEEDHNQEFHLYGPTQPIAELAFWQIVGMIRADDTGYLAKRFHIREHLKSIECRLTKSKLKVKTFDMKVATGTIPKGVLLDELHIMSSYSYASRVIGQIKGGMITRDDSFMIVITTQSDQPPSGAFKAELQLARGIRDGRVTGDAANILPILYEFSEAMQANRDWQDPACWHQVLPNLGLSISIDRLKQEWAEAQEKGEEEIRRWVSQHLNVEVGLGLHSDRWRGADFWEGAHDAELTLEVLLARAEVVVAGVDGGGLDDLYGLALAGRCKVTKDWMLWTRAWVQEDVLKLRPEIASALRDFAADGDLILCSEPTQDISEIADILEQVFGAGLLPDEAGVGLDPQGVAALLDELALRGIEGKQIVGVSQGFRLSSAVWGMERKLKDGTLWHCGQALLAWCVGNAKAEQRGNAVLITKETAGKAKIDPLVACFNAVKLLERNPSAEGASVYAERGLIRV